MALSEIFASRVMKVIAVVIAAVFVSVGIFFALNSFNSSQPTAIKLQNLPYYDSATAAVVLANNTASLSGLTSCNVYISGPSKQIKYFETVNCNSLSSTEIRKTDLLNLFSNSTGVYTVIVYPENSTQGKILQFSIS